MKIFYPNIWRALGLLIFIATFLLLTLRVPLLITVGVGAAFSIAMLLSIKFMMLIYILGFFTIIVAGVVGYYADIGQVYWICYALALGVFGRYSISQLLATKSNEHEANHKIPGFIFVYLAACFIIAASTLANFPNFDVLLVAVKIYVPFFLILFVIIKIKDKNKFIERLETFFLYLPFVQMPFVFHQHFYIYSANGNWDAIVGTFGGNPESGGASPVLMLFIIISALIAVRMFTTNRLSFVGCLLVCAACFINILLGEVKAFMVLMPLALFVQEWRLLLRRPVLAVIVIVVTLSGIYFINAFYYSNYLTAGYYQQTSIWEAILSTSTVDYVTGEVGRVASIYFWWLNSGDFLERVIGYGAASTRVKSTVALGVLGEKFYPLNLGATTVSQLLWESGFLGTALYLMALLGALLRALKLGIRNSTTVFAGRMRTLSAIFAVIIPFCFYNSTTVDQPSVQLLVAVCLALVWRYRPDDAIAKDTPPETQGRWRFAEGQQRSMRAREDAA